MKLGFNPKYNKKGFSLNLSGADDLVNYLNSMPDKIAKAEKGVINDLRKRVPGWVGQSIRQEYNLSTKDAKAQVDERISKKPSATIRTSGETAAALSFEYTGRLLTPTHFKMSPSSVPYNSKAITAMIFKGSRVSLGSTKFLMQVRSGRVLPFKRIRPGRKGIVSIKSISVPQMIQNEFVQLYIEDKLNENVNKRLEHYMMRAIK